MEKITAKKKIEMVIKIAKMSMAEDPDNAYWQDKINKFESWLKEDDQAMEEHVKEMAALLDVIKRDND